MSPLFFQFFIITYHLIQNFLAMACVAYWIKDRSYFSYFFILLSSIVATLAVFGSSYLFCASEHCLFSYTTLSLISFVVSYTIQLILWQWWFSKRYSMAWLLLLISHITAYSVCYLVFNFGSVLSWLFGK